MIALLLKFIVLGSFAGDLKAPFTQNNARVMPKGVRNLSYKGVVTSASEKYNDNSSVVPLADPLNKNLTFGEILKGTASVDEQASIEEAMDYLGYNESDSLGNLQGQVNVEATAHVPVFAIGVSERLTMAVAIPVIQSSLNVDKGVQQQNAEIHESMRDYLNAKGLPYKQEEFDEKMRDPAGYKMREYGYDTFENNNETKLGDIKLISKYQLMNNALNRVALIGEITLPTGKDQSVNKIVDVASGDDQTDLGLGVAYDYLLTNRITLSASSVYTFQLQDTNPERIPEVYDSKLTPDIDWETERDLGDILVTQFGANYSQKGLTFGGAYTFQSKGEDKYSGSAYSTERYNWLGKETAQIMHSVQVGVGYDTISLFRAKKFPVPLSLALNHTRVLAGKNVVIDPLTSLDMSIFF